MVEVKWAWERSVEDEVNNQIEKTPVHFVFIEILKF